MGINTLNESELHRVLKSLYKENNEGCQLEAEYGPYIVDIKTADGNVIEIQTQSLGHLKEKVAWFTGKKKEDNRRLSPDKEEDHRNEAP